MEKIALKIKPAFPGLQDFILYFFIFGSFFPTIRIFLIGSETSKNIFEYFISSLFDLTAIAILSYSFYQCIKYDRFSEFKYFDWLVLAFIFSNVLIGTILAENIKLSAYGFRMSYLPNLFYFVLRFNDFKEEQTKLFLNKIYNWFFILALVGIILYFGFYSSMIAMINLAGGIVNTYFITRMTSLFWSPVLFASFMSVTFLYFYFRQTTIFKRKNYIILSLLWVCILLSVTRGALIILFIGLFILTIFSKKWNVLGYLILLMTILFIFVGYYIATPLEFLTWILKSSSSTLALERGVTRVDLWIKAFADFKDHPLGYGLGKAGHVAARFFGKTSSEASVSSTDGWFLKIAGETGIWGLVSYFILAGSFVVNSFKYLRSKSYSVFHFLFVLFVVVNIQCLVSNVIDFYLFSYLFWMSLGLAINIKTNYS